MNSISSEKQEIVFCGGRALGVKILKWLISRSDVRIVFISPIPKDKDPDYFDTITMIATSKGIPIREIEELEKLEVDIGISVNYFKRIDGAYLKRCRKGFYNIHHSYNLRLKGRNITTHVMLNTLYENVHYHGTTLHKMSEKLDEGGIIASTAIPIDDSDTAYSLFLKADATAYDMFREWFPRIAYEEVFPYSPPRDGIHIYRERDLPNKEFDPNTMDEKTIDVMIRAFDFPGKEPAFFVEDGKRVHLVKDMRDQYINKIVLGESAYFSD